ncbi:conserved hypothetical protein [Microsporum canis CBS 113480]|uniref:AAA+ ATPase domain-containing protein n=1 Tax=Arthroderma otae (strain ATCC MYA-4605 / CBS 113480) TaxID=554155 RepID=C5G0D0_ARTOC|nr:conserved hypothetical protein [Microsporum canis CBS 113480]EEQ35583.1 conserved hypothetical protein [Microsporum canis CBS 113480]
MVSSPLKQRPFSQENDEKRYPAARMEAKAGATGEAQAEIQTEVPAEAMPSHLNDTPGHGEVEGHLKLVEPSQPKDKASASPLVEQMKTTPLFSSKVKGTALSVGAYPILPGARTESLFPQYGLIGLRLASYTPGNEGESFHVGEVSQNLIYTNINAPWSTFICGSQGSGKSHTLACMLENSLLVPSKTGKVSSQLTGLVLHYDKFTGMETGQLCEAAYLCSAGIPVRVLVSPSNLEHMSQLYTNLPGLPDDCPKPKVEPLLFKEDHLSIGMMKSLMAIGDGEGTPLYMEMVTKVLRDMAKESAGRRGIDFQDFEVRIKEKTTLKGQSAPLNMRLDLLRSFLAVREIRKPKVARSAAKEGDDVWNFEKGSLTIIDLSCPFVDENDACALFNICIGVFLEGRGRGGRIIALDEAHKYLTTKSREAVSLTETMLSLIRQQRHLATRVIIATQEPTLSPNLLDLCNLTVVHRFSSPAWFQALEGHLAGAVMDVTASHRSKYSTDSLFSRIVGLKTGEALVFCPSAILDVNHADNEDPCARRSTESVMTELGSSYFKMKVRKRVTADGGRSILAQ